MFLKRLVLENVGAIASCEISFESEPGRIRQRTVLTGENGTGRTTILRSIALLTAGASLLSDLLPHPQLLLSSHSRHCTLFAEIVTPENETVSIEIGIKRGDDIARVIERNRASIDRASSIASSCPTFGYGSSRRMAATGSAGSAGHDGPGRLSTLFSTDAALPSFESWALDRTARGKNRTTLIREALEDLLPGVRFSGIDRRRGALQFDTPDGIVTLSRLGDGARGLVSWFGDLLRSLVETAPARSNPLDAPALLLVDELELHLHPAVDRLLLGVLSRKLPNVQIVVTTNSALTAHQTGPGELYLLQRPPAGGPASLLPYQGDASRLMLHQLLVSPLFGLETGDSAPVEQMRREHRALKSRSGKKPTREDRARARQLEEEIRDLPRWNSLLPGEQEKRALLESIERAIRKEE